MSVPWWAWANTRVRAGKLHLLDFLGFLDLVVCNAVPVLAVGVGATKRSRSEVENRRQHVRQREVISVTTKFSVERRSGR